ncbi:hypothetical protein VB776_16165 [Arcicella sp. DC2W]|uniref:Uncharacterized protein n=1 Tax=Arcicella gelida TaxID=2984195 RepID=A0ABU5S7L2_9BACT|nr:hypothetical protein [Arcicella sp. DC2W]MEA5404468.1 hypothetical protein [Arcicella sp. DC2W]
MSQTKNPIIQARNNATIEQYKSFVIKPTGNGYSHYRAMIQESAQFWKAEAWFIQHCIETLGMTFQDFQTPTRKDIIKEYNLKKNANPVLQ